MNKNEFCQCIEALREYSIWERNLYGCGIDLSYTPVYKILDALSLAMCNFNVDWAYDAKLEFNWIIEWCFDESPRLFQERHGQSWGLTEAGALYDFLVFMNEHGWED